MNFEFALQPRQHNHGLHGYETSAESFAHVRNSLVMRNRLASAAIKSSFLHNVLKHKDKMATVKNEPLDNSISSLNSPVVAEATPTSISSLENQHRSHPGPHQHSVLIWPISFHDIFSKFGTFYEHSQHMFGTVSPFIVFKIKDQLYRVFLV